MTQAIIERDFKTPIGLYAEQVRLEQLLRNAGAKYPWCSLGVNEKGAKILLHYDLCATGNEGCIDVVPDATWHGVIANAERAIKNWQTTRYETLICRMALAIIELTDAHTECTRALLRGKKFSDAEIEAYSAQACQRAGEMAGNAPFTVLP